MPTVIALDVSLSMRRPVVGANVGEGLHSEQLTRHHLAIHGINTILHYLQTHSKLEFVSLVIKRQTHLSYKKILFLMNHFHFRWYSHRCTK